MQTLDLQPLADKLAAAMTVLLPLFTASAGWAAAQLKRNRKEMDALKKGVKGLLRAKVIDLGLHYIEEGSIPPYGMETLKGCYGPYEELGDGDPAVGHIVKACESLPVRAGDK